MSRRSIALLVAALTVVGVAACGPRGSRAGSVGTGASASPTSSAMSPTPSPTAEANLPESHWRIPRNAHAGVQGYADRTSVLPVEPVRLVVTTAAPLFVIRAVRM